MFFLSQHGNFTEPKWIIDSQLIPAEVAARSPLEHELPAEAEAESAPPLAEASDVRQNLDPCEPLLVDDSLGDVGGDYTNQVIGEYHQSMFLFFFSESV